MKSMFKQPAQSTVQPTSLGEKELLDDLLSTQKQLMGGYNYGISEASCSNLRQMMISQYNQTQQDQLKIFEQMSQRGYYPVKQAQQQDITQTAQQMNSEKSSMQ